jgi:sterol desaturase/sphingolipid hydroxylase (fatty acid hydroxylase superfamily)
MHLWLRALLGLGAFAALIWMERSRPLRRQREPDIERIARNLAIAFLGATAIRCIETQVVGRLATLAEKRRWGLVPRLRLPSPLDELTKLLLLDYTLYHWHILTHKQPFLWRFHAVHHADRDLDSLTALRFHFGELALSLPSRMAQVCAIGVGPRTLARWRGALLASVLFHHSNLRLPPQLENLLALVVMTPRLHGIHHSDVPEHRLSNWSSGLTLWDRLHKTLRRDVPQESIRIGLRELDDPDRVDLGNMLKLPFEPAELRAP